MRDLGTFELMRVWAAATGIALALWYFGEAWLHHPPIAALPLLVTAIGGFEMSLTGQDLWLRHSRRRG